MKNKIFISHSHKWKESVVNPLVSYLGKDNVVVDEFCFESGKTIRSEIRKAINDCAHFLYLISNDALDSEWVTEEISYVRELVDDDKVNFIPVIIDETVDINDIRIKTWIRKQFLTKRILHPKPLSRLLRGRIREYEYRQDSKLGRKRSLFLGRDKEMSILKAKVSDAKTQDDPRLNTIIVSGLSHLGRKKFLREFLVREVKSNIVADNIFTIELSSTDDAWVFAQLLNDCYGEVSPIRFNEMYPTPNEILTFIKDKLRLIKAHNEVFVIKDEGAIVKRDGKIADWFISLIKDVEFKNEIFFNVVSRFSPRLDINYIFKEIVSITLREIEKEWLIRIYNEYCKIKEHPVNQSIAEECVEVAQGYPKPIYLFVDYLIDGNNQKKALTLAKNLSAAITKENFKEIYNEILQNNSTAIDVLKVLSYTPFLSWDDLQTILDRNIGDDIDILDNYCLTQYTGRDSDIISICSGMSDYIRRSHGDISEKIMSNIKKFATNEFGEECKDISNIGGFILAQRELIKSNIDDVPLKNLLPPITLKMIKEYYYQKENKIVILLADKLINGYYKLDADLERAAKFWLCSALAKEKDKRLLKEVKVFTTASYSYNFLMGFYYRHISNDNNQFNIKALDFFEKAYEIKQRNDSEFDNAFLLHEMWMIKFELEHPDTLKLAKEFYNTNPNNPYHIEAYIRSLLAAPNFDKDLARSLIEDLKIISNHKSSIIAETLGAELEYWNDLKLDRLFNKIKTIIERASSERDKSYPFMILKRICKKQNAEPAYRTLKKQYPDIRDAQK